MPFGIEVFEIVVLVVASFVICVLGAIGFLLVRKVTRYLDRR